jgi:hypothetical protein
MKPPWERNKPLARVPRGRLRVTVQVIESKGMGSIGYRRSRTFRAGRKSYAEVVRFMAEIFAQWVASPRLRTIRGGRRSH